MNVFALVHCIIPSAILSFNCSIVIQIIFQCIRSIMTQNFNIRKRILYLFRETFCSRIKSLAFIFKQVKQRERVVLLLVKAYV
ncbi:hypothetical protein RIF29_13535 [Crotalaria pallida]|uniref:Uncharacterized protein n=1 Tax=Crotalaria pallida TaxID=3830 RepID=A0AAN9P369_CROPI